MDQAQLWVTYRRYVEKQLPAFPGAYALAMSEWYFAGLSHRSPHDGWLEHVTVSEAPEADREQPRATFIHIRLLGAYHDGHIDLKYRQVTDYIIGGVAVHGGLGDWRYDEFRVGSAGQLVHEIEWWSVRGSSTWMIEAADVEYTWTPFDAGQMLRPPPATPSDGP